MARICIIDLSAITGRIFGGSFDEASPERFDESRSVQSVIQRVLKTQQAVGAQHVVVALDSYNSRDWRRSIFEDYKKGRKPWPEEYASFRAAVEAELGALRIPLREAPGFEADDVAAALAEIFASRGHNVVVASPDHDFAQLVADASVGRPAVRWWRETSKGTGRDLEWVSRMYRVDDVVEVFGVPPVLIPDLLAFGGDSSDGIPGVRRLGPGGLGLEGMKPTELLVRFRGLEGVLENLDEIHPRVRSLIEKTGAGQLAVYKKLTTMQADCLERNGT